jgi:hypothetical protein
MEFTSVTKALGRIANGSPRGSPRLSICPFNKSTGPLTNQPVWT